MAVIRDITDRRKQEEELKKYATALKSANQSLEQLFAALRGKGLVRGVRGPGGGYYLGRDPHDISVADVICAVDEWVEYTRSSSYRNSRDVESVSTRSLWDDLSEQIFDFLDNISLAQLVERGTQREAATAAETGGLVSLGLRDRAA